MSFKKLTKSLFFLSMILMGLAFVLPSKYKDSAYIPRKMNLKTSINDAVKWMHFVKSDLVSGQIDLGAVLNARLAAEELMKKKSEKAVGLTWYEVGPDNVGGRTRAILWDKNDPTYRTIYAGAVSGGLWKSTDRGSSWQRVSGLSDNLAISCIAQGPDGTIYVGTGEGLAQPGGTNTNSGTFGGGLFKSTDGVNFSVIATTKPTPYSPGDWSTINRVGCDPVNPLRIYVAAHKFLQTDDGGVNWYTPKYLLGGSTYTAIPGYAKDVKIGTDGSVAVCAGSNGSIVYCSTNGDDQTYYKCSGTTAGMLPLDVTRVELAIAPSDPNYIYALPASTSSAIKGLYRSIDRGRTWTLLAPGGSANFDVFGYGDPDGHQQGWYNNVIAVFPNDKDHIVFGGINMWEWKLGSEPNQISIGDEAYRYKYIHVDHHAYVFHPTDPNVLMVGTDGGLSISIDGAYTFTTINRYFAVTQFYSVSTDAFGCVMGGTQDNSTPYIERTGANPKNARVLWAGDGGWSAFSLINPGAMFFTSQNASLGRTSDRYTMNLQGTRDANNNPAFFSASLLADVESASASFVTPLIIWEGFDDKLTKDSIKFVADTNYYPGQRLVIKSKTSDYPFEYFVEDTLHKLDTLKIQDIIQSKFYLGINGGVWMTKEALNFGKVPEWFKVAIMPGTVQALAASSEGNYLFVGVQDGFNAKVYRVSNIQAAYDSSTYNSWTDDYIINNDLIATFPYRSITSVAVDPQAPNRVLVTLGNFGANDYIYLSTNALDETPLFESRQGNLPKMPVYSAIFEMNHPYTVIIGTEYGVYATAKIYEPSTQWSPEINGSDIVPVFMIRQQTMKHWDIFNTGVIYIGTHGRGIFECGRYYQPTGIEDKKPVVDNTNLTVFPNPVRETANISFNLNSRENVTIQVYNMSGKLISTQNLPGTPAGKQKTEINCSSFEKGVYIIQLKAGNNIHSGKFIVM